MPQDHPDGTVPMQITGADKKLPTDFQDQNVGVHSEAEFEVKQGKDKKVGVVLSSRGFAESDVANYTVPAGKTLYICGVSVCVRASLAADYDHFLHITLMLRDETLGSALLSISGVGGANMPLLRPLVFEAGHQLSLTIINYANVTCEGVGYIFGYEV